MSACRGDESATRSDRAVVRPARVDDTSAVAHLHASEIGEGFLASLGTDFLERLYRRLCRTPGSFAFVAEEDAAVVGFVAGTVSTRRLFTVFLLRDGPAVCLRSPLRLLRSSRAVLETLRHGRSGAAAERAGTDADHASAELLAIAVDPRRRRRGLAARLVRAMLDEAARRGASGVDVVVGAGNEPAIAMYRGAGFVPARRFELHKGVESFVLRHPGANRTDGEPVS